jgi:hypothetical protein
MKKVFNLLLLYTLFDCASLPLYAQNIWSNAGVSYPSIVYALAEYNGVLQAGGMFSTPNEIHTMYVYNGNLYSGGTNGGAITQVYKNGVSVGATNGANNLIFAMAVYNNQLYVAGSFTSINGVAANNIARWNGSVWSAAGTGSGVPGDYINALCVYNNNLYAGGGQSGNCEKWNGTSWSVAGNFTNSGAWGYLRSMGVYNGELYVGGTFDSINGTAALNLAKYNGSFWSSGGDFGIANNGDGVSAIAAYNGELYCGGRFSIAGGTAASNIARGDGLNWQALGNGTDGVVLALLVYNQSLYAAGNFTVAGSITVGNIAKWAPPCAPPSATITYTGAPYLCNPGGSIFLSANTGTGLTYQWKLSNSNIGGATTSTYLVTAIGIYSVVVTNAAGCSKTSSTVPIGANTVFADISPAGPTTFCSGSSVVLNAYLSPNYTYQWRKNGIDIAGATTSSYVATTAGDYTVAETGGPCTKISTVESVVVNPLPSAVIIPAGPITFCSGGSVVLNAPVAANRIYQWKKGGVAISGATSSSFTATTGGIYKVIVTNTASGCSKTTIAGTTVTVNSSPAATITPQGPTTFCAGGSVVLKANSGTGLTYKWKRNGSNISGATSLNYTATTAGIYKVEVTNSNGCSKLSTGAQVTVPCREGGNTIEIFDVNAHPNPSSGDFVLEIQNGDRKKTSIDIFDMVGKLILSGETINRQFTIHNSQLVPGVYSAQIMNGEKKYVLKLVKTE